MTRVVQYTRHKLPRNRAFVGVEYWTVRCQEPWLMPPSDVVRVFEKAPSFTVFSTPRLPAPSEYKGIMWWPDERWSLFEVNRPLQDKVEDRLHAMSRLGLGATSLEPQRDDEFWLSESRDNEAWDDMDAAAMALLRGVILMKVPSPFNYSSYFVVDYDHKAAHLLGSAPKIH